MSVTTGNDTLTGTAGNDVIDLLAGNDSYLGLGGNDSILGNDGNDIIYGGNGADSISGGNGNDIIYGEAGSDSIDAGAGTFDSIRYNQTGGEAITANISLIGPTRGGYNTATVATATQGTDSIINFEAIVGSGNNDSFNVTDGATFYAGIFLFANSGNDTITSSADLYGPYSNVFADYDAASTNTGFTRGVSVDLQTGTDTLGRPIGSATDYAGTDRLVGVRGVAATSLNDTIYGTAFDDRFRPYAGNDIMDGREGFDIADYSSNSSSQAVSVNLVTGRANDGRGGADTLISIEQVRAGSGDDTLLGNVFSEVFRGNVGNDSIDGGLGSDRIDYFDTAATSGVSVNLITGTATDGRGGIDRFTSIENVFGGELNDYLVGIGQDGQTTSRLRGDAGSDTLVGIDGEYVVADYATQTVGLSVNLASGSVNDGMGGVDSLINIRGAQMYGNFADTLIGSNGDDWLAPSGGNDSIVGGNGFDVLSYDGNPTRGVSVNLATGTANDGDGGADIFTGIEAVRTGYSNDTVIGDSGFNGIVLGAGADYADAAGGNDVVSYRFGFSPNAVAYTYSESGDGRLFSGVTIDLAAGRATDYGGSVDTILNFEYANGSSMHDSILGSSGDNELEGWEGNDTINGGAGNDTIWKGPGDDLLMGGAGNDLYRVDAATGRLIIDDASGNDTVDFGGVAGREIFTSDISSMAGINAFDLVGSGNTLHLTAARAISVSGTGLFRVFGGGADRIIFDDTGWVRTGSAGGFDTLANAAGNATVIASSGLASVDINSVVTGGDGNDVIGTGLGNDTIDGGNGSDIIAGFGGNDSILGGNGSDSIDGGDGADTILGGIGNDRLQGGAGNDSLSGGTDNDFIDGGNGSDVAAYNSNASSQAVSVNLLDGRAADGLGGTDTLISIENVWGGAGNDTIIGGNGADSLWGNSGNDTLLGGNGADTLDGGSGNDTITGGDGGDRIFGGTGSDSIDAGVGTGDAVSFNHTSAQAVSATISAIGGSAGSNYAEVRTASQGNDTIINFEDITGSFENDGFTINSAATDNSLLYVFGSIGADTIAVNNASNAVMANYNTPTGSTNFTRGVVVDLTAGTADDGRGGIDSLIGVRGVSGSSFGDTILGSVFNDRFRENGGSDSINGRDGFDMLDYSGNSASQSVSVNLAAGRASDGRGGTDTVISMEYVRSGSGNDTMIGSSAGNEFRGGNGADILDGGASGFDIADYANNTSAQAISVNLITGRASDGFGFNDTLVSIEYVRGGSGNDTMIGGGANERFRGNAGNDTIDGGGGTEDILDLSQTTQSVSANLVTGVANDGLDGTDRFTNVEVVYSGTANDTLLGSDRNEIFDGGMGGDLIDGGLGYDRVRYWNVSGRNAAITRGVSVDLAAQRATDGWGGQDTLIGIERVTATNFNDTLLGDNVGNRFNGRAGNDSIDGGLASDWLEYLDGDATAGVTVNLTTGTASDGRGGTDIFTSIENVSGQDFADHLTGIAQLGRSTSRLRGAGGNDTLVGIANEFVVADYTDQTMGLSVNLASGSVNDGLGGIDQLVNIRGAIMLGNYADTIIGTAGNDWLSPGGGNDTISGGNGLDIISYDGNPTAGVSVNLATGRASDGDGGTDSLSGIEGVWVSYSNDTVIGDNQANLIGLGAGADSADAASGQDTISYSLGFSPNTSVYVFNEAQNQLPFTGVRIDLAAGRATDQGGATDTILNFEAAIGSTMHDSILGSIGDNQLAGAEGNDTINGGAGNDTLVGGVGNDTLSGGNGIDWASYASATGAVTVNLGAGSSSGADGNDSLTGIENILGSSFADSLQGGNGNSQALFGDVGNDTLVAGGGLSQRLYGGADNDRLIGGTGANQSLAGEAGDDTLIAGNGFGQLLDGGNGRDTMLGGNGADTLDGGLGNDSMSGGAGNDVFIVDSAGDMVSDSAGTDTILLRTGSISLAVIQVENVTGDISGQTFSITGNSFANVLTGGVLGDTISALVGADTVYGLNGNDRLDGGSENDLIDGGNGADTIIGGTGDDTMIGGLGSDSMSGGAGNDSITGGTDIDWLTYADLTASSQAVTINLVTGRASGAAGADTITGIENVLTGAGNDSLFGDSLANMLSASAGNDTLSGGNGADTLDGGLGNDSMSGGAGNDSITGGTDIDWLTYADLTASSQAVTINLVTGRASGAAGADSITGIENVLTGAGNDSLFGDSLANMLSASVGNDTLSGGDGNDTLDGGFGNDCLSGGAGNDFYIVDSATDVVQDAAGTDTILLRTGSINLVGVSVENVVGDIAGATFNIGGNAAATRLTGGSLNDTILAYQGADTVYGLDGNDRLDGGSENDLIDGGNGADTIIGGTGDDTMIGGLGSDSFNGGTGTDRFIFNSALGATNVDTILGYTVADDTILLDDAIFTALGSPGTLAAGAFKASAAATDADDRIIYNAGTGALLYDADGTGATAAVQFATLTGAPVLINTEFVII